LEELRHRGLDATRPSVAALGHLYTDVKVALGASLLGALLVVAMRAPAHTKPPAPPPVPSAPPEPPVVVAAPLASLADAGEPANDAAALAETADAAPPRAPTWRVSSLEHDPSVTYTEGAVGKRPLAVALAAAGMPRLEVQRVLHAFTGVKNLNHASPKDTFAFARDKPAGHVVAFEYATSPEDVWQAKEESGALDATKLDLAVEEKTRSVGVALGDDLRASVVAAGLDDDIVGLIDDALDGRVERNDLRAGARLRLVATEERIDSRFTRYSRLDAVEYTPADPDGQALRVYYFHHAPTSGGSAERAGSERGTHGAPGKGGGFYDQTGKQPYHGGWRTPVPLARIASRFNPQRMHPVLHVVMPHNGVDFAAPVGTPIYASAAGVVKSAGDSGPCGNMVQIDHAGGLTSAYCHMSRFAPGIHAGQHVESRQLIGYVGQTGRATGPHLHFAIKRGEVYMDPLALKLDGVRVVPVAYRDEFAKVRADDDAALDAVALPRPVPGAVAADKGDKKTEETVFDDSPGL
jgi:murein DD-endopeptidase MepM/ murein hydrolase activator NlpD